MSSKFVYCFHVSLPKHSTHFYRSPHPPHVPNAVPSISSSVHISMRFSPASSTRCSLTLLPVLLHLHYPNKNAHLQQREVSSAFWSDLFYYYHHCHHFKPCPSCCIRLGSSRPTTEHVTPVGLLSKSTASSYAN